MPLLLKSLVDGMPVLYALRDITTIRAKNQRIVTSTEEGSTEDAPGEFVRGHRTVSEQVERFGRYTLSGVLPPEYQLVLDHRHELAILQNAERDVVEVVTFPHIEYLLFKTLLLHVPYYCPYEYLYAAYYNKDVEQSRQELVEESYGSEDWDILIRPVRNLLSRVRIKMKAFGIVPRSMIDAGYLLVPLRELASKDGERR